jgi:hypothetical protein
MAVVTVSLFAVGAVAQTNEVDARKKAQQERIAQGVKSGKLTPGETANLEKKEAAINREVKTDRTLNGGKLTPQEKRAVNRQQNRMSAQIARKKTNAAKQHYGANKVDTRRQNQQKRIASGVASGKLSAAETAKLEKGQAGINKEVRADRAANGGKLTPAEKKQVSQQQNVASKKIAQEKHN